jgi:hypothetical protein
MAALEIIADTYQMLTYDLQTAIDQYTTALAAHADTVGEAAPGTTMLVETIVKHHDGLFVIVQAPAAPEKQPLPTDPKYYKSKADQLAIAAQAAEAAGAAPPEVEPK